MATVLPSQAALTRFTVLHPRHLLTVGPHDNRARERPIHLTTAGLHILARAAAPGGIPIGESNHREVRSIRRAAKRGQSGTITAVVNALAKEG
jgi:hypothetical protein